MDRSKRDGERDDQRLWKQFSSFSQILGDQCVGLGSSASPAGGLPFSPSFSLTPGQPQPRTILFSRFLLLSGKDVSNMKAALVGDLCRVRRWFGTKYRNVLFQLGANATGSEVKWSHGPWESGWNSFESPGCSSFGFSITPRTRIWLGFKSLFQMFRSSDRLFFLLQSIVLFFQVPQLAIVNHIPFNHQGIFWNDSIIQDTKEACLCFRKQSDCISVRSATCRH